MGVKIEFIEGLSQKNPLDLNLGRRPELNSDEFSGTTPLVIEIISLLCEIAGRSSCTLSEPDPWDVFDCQ